LCAGVIVVGTGAGFGAAQATNPMPSKTSVKAMTLLISSLSLIPI
jgi:hypothetical protein